MIALTIYALTTKTDFTVCGGVLCVCLGGLILLGIFSFVFGPTMAFVYDVLGVILFGVYLIYDTQMICGGKKNSISKDDYILGALNIYLDIINLFL